MIPNSEFNNARNPDTQIAMDIDPEVEIVEQIVDTMRESELHILIQPWNKSHYTV